jgi:hypothetical protein
MIRRTGEVHDHHVREGAWRAGTFYSRLQNRLPLAWNLNLVVTRSTLSSLSPAYLALRLPSTSLDAYTLLSYVGLVLGHVSLISTLNI